MWRRISLSAPTQSVCKLFKPTTTIRRLCVPSSIQQCFKSSTISRQVSSKTSVYGNSIYLKPGVSCLQPKNLLFTSSTNTGKTSSSSSLHHPLDPLTSEEIKCTSTTVKEYLEKSKNQHGPKQSIRFVSVSLCEPDKKDLLKYQSNQEEVKLARKAEVVTLINGICSEWIVDISSLKDAHVIHHIDLPTGTQPLYSPDDCDLAEEIVKSSPEVQQVVMERYGIQNVNKELVCDPWSVHLADDDDKALTIDEKTGLPRRLIQTFLYQRMLNIDTLEDNHYAHPIDIVPVVDLNTGKVIRIDGMNRHPVPKVPELSVNYHRNLLSTNSYLQTKWRSETLRDLDVIQKDGPSFLVDGNHVSWQKWTFRVGFNYREGLVLHDLKYEGRDVLHRASLVEMAVPYGDPHPPFQRKCAFDVGDYGLGYCANSLELGCDWYVENFYTNKYYS